jgi:pimeloyl-ACP methyl ester carboxylesterase
MQFKGFGGVRLEAEVIGDEHDPAILLVHGAGQTRSVWGEVAQALVQSGRRVVSLDLRGHGGSEWPADGRYDFEAFVEDLRAVLAQLGGRPVVVAATLGGWVAAAALETDAALLAAGLVLVDLPTRSDPETFAASACAGGCRLPKASAIGMRACLTGCRRWRCPTASSLPPRRSPCRCCSCRAA